MSTNKLPDSLFLTVFEQSASAMLIKADANFTIIAASDAYLQLTGVSKQQLIGKGVFEIPQINSHFYVADALRNSFAQLIKTKQVTYQQYTDHQLSAETIGKPDQQYWSVTNKPILGNNGEVAYIIYTPVNITNQVSSKPHVQGDALFRKLVTQAPANDVSAQVLARQKIEIIEERLRLATEATGLGTFDLNLLTDEVVYSARLCEILGYPGSEILSHTDMRSLVHPDDVPVVEAAFNNALDSGMYFYEVRNIWPDGSIHWMRTQGNILFDAKGKPVRMVGAVIDVTSQRHIINELRQSEENLRLAAEAGELGTFDLNFAEGRFSWDARHRKIFGIKADEEIGPDTFFRSVHPDDRGLIDESIELATSKREDGGDYDVDYRIINRETQKVQWIRAKGKSVVGQDGRLLRLVGTVIDITDRKQDEIRKNDFIAMASHELKTPLTSLKAYIQMLLARARKTENEFFASALEKADNQIEKMTRLIYGFLDLSKIESGRLELELSEFDITDAINEAIADVNPIAQNHRIVFEPQQNYTVHADKEKITQVAINLINNAIKYSPRGTSISITVEDIGAWIQIAVKDEGIGIGNYDIERIFQRFYRVQEERTKGFSGFGIGLYLCAEIIALHQGEINAESNGVGSTFYFRLPK